MKTSFISLAALLAMSSFAAHAEDAQWEGTLSVPTQNLVTRVEKRVVMPDQIDFALPKFKATYSAT